MLNKLFFIDILISFICVYCLLPSIVLPTSVTLFDLVSSLSDSIKANV